MADSNMMMPSGSGGLLRYNEEYPSKLRLSPIHVIIMIVAVILGMAVIKLFFNGA